jgi:hypothetical protein
MMEGATDMFVNREGMIHVNMDYQQIQDEKLRALLNLCFSISDTVSISQSHNIGMTKAEAEEALSVYQDFCKKNGFLDGLKPSEEEMFDLYEQMAETKEELQELIRKDRESRAKYEANFKKTDEEVDSYLQELFADYQLASRDVTCMTPCTMGGPQVMYFLTVEAHIMDQFYRMKDLFEPVISDEERELRLDDPAFYKEGKIVMVVCSHEQYASLFLDDKQYGDFKKLNISHETR